MSKPFHNLDSPKETVQKQSYYFLLSVIPSSCLSWLLNIIPALQDDSYGKGRFGSRGNEQKGKGLMDMDSSVVIVGGGGKGG